MDVTNNASIQKHKKGQNQSLEKLLEVELKIKLKTKISSNCS